MNFLKKIAAGAATLVALAVATTGVVSAAQYQCNYNAATQTCAATSTSTTPVFNNFDNTPENIGSEANFVKVGNAANIKSPFAFATSGYGNSVTGCTNGEKFYILTYVHNNADDTYNNQTAQGQPNGQTGVVGNGSAVARNTTLAQTASLGTNTNFTFKSTVSASNATSVSDSVSINCGSDSYTMTMVPSSAQIISLNSSKPNFYNYAPAGLPDSVVNGSTKIGSDSPTSGNVCGCWDCRVLVVYEVTITAKPVTPTASAACTLFQVEADNRTIKVTNFNTSVQNATFNNMVINWGDNTSSTITSQNAVAGTSHTYDSSLTGKVAITTLVNFLSTVDGSTIASPSAQSGCGANITFNGTTTPPTITPPTVTPPVVTPPAVTRPKTLINTGAGDTIGIFAAVSIAGAVAHRWFLSRRLSRQ